MQFIFRRLGFYIAAFWVAITINFLLPRMMPGDPATALFIQNKGRMSQEALAALKKAYGFGQGNLWSQYFEYIQHLAVGDFGVSFMFYPEPVFGKLAYAGLWTLFLVAISLLISFVLGTFLGTFAGWMRGRTFDSLSTPFSVILSSFMPAIVGLLLWYYLAFQWDWFPLGRAHDLEMDPEFSWAFIRNMLFHAVLPILSIVLVSVGGWHFLMRNNMINLLNEDFITMAKAKGLSKRRVLFKYAARNALMPSLTSLALQIGYLLGGALFTEMVFNYPGLGYFSLSAIQRHDYPFIQGQLLFITVGVLLMNLVADVINVFLDPRIRYSGKK